MCRPDILCFWELDRSGLGLNFQAFCLEPVARGDFFPIPRELEMRPASSWSRFCEALLRLASCPEVDGNAIKQRDVSGAKGRFAEQNSTLKCHGVYMCSDYDSYGPNPSLWSNISLWHKKLCFWAKHEQFSGFKHTPCLTHTFFHLLVTLVPQSKGTRFGCQKRSKTTASHRMEPPCSMAVSAMY